MLSTNKPQRGEVWQVQFDPSVGAEIRKTRRCVLEYSGAALALVRSVLDICAEIAE